MEKEIQAQREELDIVAPDCELRRANASIEFELADGEEVLSLRSECGKQFDLGENRFQAIQYPEPVHYRKAGAWEEIDNNLVEGETEGGRKVLRNRANALICEVPVEADGGALVTLKNGKNTLAWQFERDAQSVQAVVHTGQELKRDQLIRRAKERHEYAKRDVESFTDEELKQMETGEERRSDLTEKTSQVEYNEILPGVTVRYTLSGGQLKEDIIAQDREALSRIPLRLPGRYTYLVNEDQSVSVRDQSDREIFSFDMPVVYDAHRVSTIAKVLLTRCDGYVRLNYELDEDFLAAAQFPVTIDPVARDRGTSSNVEAFYVNTKKNSNDQYDSNNHTSTKLLVGKNGTKEYATVLRFKTLALLKASDTVVSAKLKLTVMTPSTAKNHYVGAYEILKADAEADWSIDSATWGTFTHDYAINPDVLDYAVGGGSTMSFDLTNLYRQWYRADNNGDGTNYGIMLRCIPVTQQYFAFCSPRVSTKSNRPLMTVNYISHAGLESWWQYESQSAGRAGTTNVDLFNGNVVHAHPDTAMNGNRMPVSVTHYYNSCQSATADLNTIYRCGMGWKHSGLQFIYEKKINSAHYFVWVDGDGTEHWFKNDSKYYEVETYDLEGMGLKLHRYCSTAKRQTRIEIEDQSHTVMTFQYRLDANKGKSKAGWARRWLISVKDSLGNKVAYTYQMPESTEMTSTNVQNLEGKLLKITDPAGRETVFNYSPDGTKLESIQTPDSNPSNPDTATQRTVSFSYTGALLTGISYSDLAIATPHTKFTYASGTNLLETAQNYDGLQVKTLYEAVDASATGFTENEDVDNSDDEDGTDSLEDPVEIVTASINYELSRASSLETSKGTETNVTYGAKLLFNYMNSATSVTVVDDTDSNDGKALVYQFNDKGNVISVKDELGYAQFTKYESGHENTPSAVSKLQKAVINRIRRADLSSVGAGASSDAVWKQIATAPNLISVDETAEGRCLNLKSMKLVRKSATGDLYYRQQVTLEKGKTYTLSAFVKTDDIEKNGSSEGAFMRLRLTTGNAETVAASASLEGDTEDDMEEGLPTDDWERQRMTYTVPSGDGTMDLYVEFVNNGISGTAWFAAPQLEEDVVANSVNLLSNGDFLLTQTESGGSRTFPLDWVKGKGVGSSSAIGVYERESDPTSNSYDPYPEKLSGKYLKLISGAQKEAQDTYFYQNVYMSGKKGDVFFAGGWASAKAMPGSTAGARQFALVVQFYCKPKGKSSYKWYTGKGGKLPFNSEWVGWQAAGGAVGAPYSYAQVRVYLTYKGQPNAGKFSNVFLFREEFGKTFLYDKDKRMTDVSTLSGQQAGMEYDKQNNLISYRKPGVAKEDRKKYTYKMTYGGGEDEKKKHLVRSTTSPEEQVAKYTYDDFGNKTAQRATNKDGKTFIRTETAYDDKGNYAISKTDARGKTATMKVDPRNGLLRWAKDPAETQVSYTYDLSGRMTNVSTTTDGSTFQNDYTYEDDRLKTVRHNTSANSSEDVTYTFEYDVLGAQTQVKVGTQVLSTNVYDTDRSHKLLHSEFANGGLVANTYDQFDRIEGVRFDGDTVDRYEYEYGANGQVSQVTDNLLNRTHYTEYDLALKPKRSTTKNATGDILYRATLKYDKYNHLTGFGELVKGRDAVGDDDGTEAFLTTYEYDKDDRTTEVQYEDEDHRVNYEYDAVGRVSKKTVLNGENEREITYGYLAGGQGSGSTTPLVSKITQPDLILEYEYDDVGNITKETRKASASDEGSSITYTYDKLGQLTRVNDPFDTTAGEDGTTWQYVYDLGGNILSKSYYVFTTGTVGAVIGTSTYAYGDANWKDKLTGYKIGTADELPITYDVIGNPLSYNNWTYTWEKGRQLRKMMKGTEQTVVNAQGKSVQKLVSGERMEFAYDAAGLRVQKKHSKVTAVGSPTTVQVVTTDYFLHGKLVMHLKQTTMIEMVDDSSNVTGPEIVSTDQMHFFYDAQSQPTMVNFNGTLYTYAHNLQGDIVAIVDSTGTKVVEYKYDAWGKPLDGYPTGGLKDTLGKLNPFRYRKYMYDNELMTYYLEDRYYRPTDVRFINSDKIIKSNIILGSNQYLYCRNNPLAFVDTNGCTETEYGFLSYNRTTTTAIGKPYSRPNYSSIKIQKYYKEWAISAQGTAKLINAAIDVALVYVGGSAAVKGAKALLSIAKDRIVAKAAEYMTNKATSAVVSVLVKHGVEFLGMESVGSIVTNWLDSKDGTPDGYIVVSQGEEEVPLSPGPSRPDNWHDYLVQPTPSPRATPTPNPLE
jgi:RHS repeat-associated protein